jgi:hypothetical protein
MPYGGYGSTAPSTSAVVPKSGGRKTCRPTHASWVHLEPADQVVIVEGTAQRTAGEGDPEVLAVQKAYKGKYKMDHPAPFWRVTPKLAFAWTDFTKDATRWKF